MMDAASEDQLMEEQPIPNQEDEDAVAMETDEEVVPLDEDGKEKDVSANFYGRQSDKVITRQAHEIVLPFSLRNGL